jgi:vitamin B12 transporter
MRPDVGAFAKIIVLLLPLLAGACCTLAQQTARPSAVNQTVVVLGSAEPVTEGESSRSVTVIDAQEHPLALQDVAGYLRTDASVDIRQRGPMGVQSDISIRGGSFEQTLVLLNGLRINDAQTSHFNLDLPVPQTAIAGMDVLHGAGSTLYGADALGGVVDFLTWKPEESSLRLRVGVGNFGVNTQAVTAAAAGRRWSEVVAGGRDFSTGFSADRDYRSESGSSEMRFNSALGATDVLLAGSDRAFGADQFYGNYNSWERTKGWFLSLTQDFDADTTAAVSYRRHSDLFVLLRDQPSYYKNQHIDESWQGVVRRKQRLSRWSMLFFGAEENTDQIQSNSLGRHGRNRSAGYLDLDLRSEKRGSLSFGLREEVLSGGRAISTPVAAGAIWVRPSVKARASVGYGFRLPTYVNLYYSDPTTQSNPSLKPESAWTSDAGVDWYLGNRTVASVTVFHSRQSDAIDYVRASPADRWQAANLTGLRFTGVESSLQTSPRQHQQLLLSWILTLGAQDALQGLQSEYVFTHPVNNASAQWVATGPEGLMIRTRLGVTQRYQKIAYPVLDVSVARDIGRVHPYVQLTNLSNTGYEEITGVRMPGRGVAGGVEILLRHRPW